jgi:peroxiredoxin
MGRAELVPGARFPDLELPDHTGSPRRLSELVAGDPALLHFYRGWWCPKERAFLRGLVALQAEAEVAHEP